MSARHANLAGTFSHRAFGLHFGFAIRFANHSFGFHFFYLHLMVFVHICYVELYFKHYDWLFYDKLAPFQAITFNLLRN